MLLMNKIIVIEDLLEFSVGRLFCGLQCKPGVPDCLEPLISKLFDEVVRTFLIPIMLNTPLALFSIFVKRLSLKSLVHFS